MNAHQQLDAQEEGQVSDRVRFHPERESHGGQRYQPEPPLPFRPN